jgi:hypothetical protein
MEMKGGEEERTGIQEDSLIFEGHQRQKNEL